MGDFMTTAYGKLRDVVKPSLVLHFGTLSQSSIYGNWNLAESYKQDMATSPKYQSFIGLLQTARSKLSPPVSAGCSALQPPLSCAGS